MQNALPPRPTWWWGRPGERRHGRQGTCASCGQPNFRLLKCSESLRRHSAPTMIPAESPPPRYTRTHDTSVANLHERDDPCLPFVSLQNSNRASLQRLKTTPTRRPLFETGRVITSMKITTEIETGLNFCSNVVVTSTC
jgi:hypothetical protein